MSLPRTPLKRMIAMPRLWWHAKGYGVHSPSAYSYVRSVVHEPWHYYAYSRVDKLAREASMSRRTARLLMRAGLWEQSNVAVCECVRPQVREIVTAWSSEAKTIEKWAEGCSMMVVGGEKNGENDVLTAVERVMRQGGTIVLLDAAKRTGAARTVLDRMLAQEDRPGVLMTDGRSAIVHVEPGVPGQYYEMLL